MFIISSSSSSSSTSTSPSSTTSTNSSNTSTIAAPPTAFLFFCQRRASHSESPYYSTPREESFTILLRERNPLLFYSERGILYYSTPREESFTILLRERNPLLFYSERGIRAGGGLSALLLSCSLMCDPVSRCCSCLFCVAGSNMDNNSPWQDSEDGSARRPRCRTPLYICIYYIYIYIYTC